MMHETIQALINVADEALFTCKGNHLTDIQRLILRESLLGKKYEAMEGYETQHFKNEGANLWKLLEEALGEPISKSNFRAALERRASLPVVTSSLATQFSRLLSIGEEASIIRLFLQENPKIIRKAFDADRSSRVVYSCSLPNQILDICVGKAIPTMGRWEWNVVFLGRVSGNLHESIEENLLKMKMLRRLCTDNMGVVQEVLPGFQVNFFCHIVIGQRENLSQKIYKEIQNINEYETGVRVRTYDWLLDEAEALLLL
jgi:hypothetical protein